MVTRIVDATHLLSVDFHQYENQSLPYMWSIALIIKEGIILLWGCSPGVNSYHHFHVHHLSLIDLIDK